MEHYKISELLNNSTASNVSTFVDNAEDLDIVVLMYNLLEYNGNYFMTSGNLWNSYTDEVNDDENENNNSGNYRITNSKTTTSKSEISRILEVAGDNPAEGILTTGATC